jgi:hypothetical protein
VTEFSLSGRFSSTVSTASVCVMTRSLIADHRRRRVR